VTDLGVEALVDSGYLGQLAHLDLSRNEISRQA
jgi:hypothetical protein